MWGRKDLRQVGWDGCRGGEHPLKLRRGREKGEGFRRAKGRSILVERWRRWREQQGEMREEIVWGREEMRTRGGPITEARKLAMKGQEKMGGG